MRDDEEKFLNFVRLTKAEYVELLSLVRPFITKKTPILERQSLQN